MGFPHITGFLYKRNCLELLSYCCVIPVIISDIIFYFNGIQNVIKFNIVVQLEGNVYATMNA